MLLDINPQALALKAKLFRGLGDVSRLAIIEALRDGSHTVTEIVEATGLGQPNVSNHLGCLQGCGLVSREQRGRYAYYRLSDGLVSGLLQAADTLLESVGRNVYECTRQDRLGASR